MSKAVVLLSGGLDSATTLAIAKSEGYECYALSVNYHQRHITELEAAKKIAVQFKVKAHKTVEMDLSWMLTSALTNPDLKVPTELTTQIPITYVPARNTLMLTLALGWAEVIGAHDIFIGVNAVDYSGYPDCRPEYIEQFQKMACLHGSHSGRAICTRSRITQKWRVACQFSSMPPGWHGNFNQSHR